MLKIVVGLILWIAGVIVYVILEQRNTKTKTGDGKKKTQIISQKSWMRKELEATGEVFLALVPLILLFLIPLAIRWSILTYNNS